MTPDGVLEAADRHVSQAERFRVLSLMMAEPGAYIHRRVDRICDVTSTLWRVETHLSIELPEPEAHDGGWVIVSLGLFDKRRLPGLRAVDQSGEELMVLGRRQRVHVLVAILLGRYLGASQLPPESKSELANIAAEIINSEPDRARRLVEKFERRSNELGNTTGLEQQLAYLADLTTSTHVLALAQRTGPRLVMLTTSTQSNAYPTHRLLPSDLGRSKRLRLQLRLLAMNIGLLSVPFRVQLNGANHSESYYMVLETPSGVEVDLAYWKALSDRPEAKHEPESAATSSRHYEEHDGSGTILACYHRNKLAHGGKASIDMRLDGAALREIWILAGSLAVIAAYIYQADLKTVEELRGWIALVLGIPATMLAFINERSSELSMRIGRWLKRAVLGLAVCSGLLVISVLRVRREPERPTSDAEGEAARDIAVTYDYGEWFVDLRWTSVLMITIVVPLFVTLTWTSLLAHHLPRPVSVENPSFMKLDDVRAFRQQRRAWALLPVITALVATAAVLTGLS